MRKHRFCIVTFSSSSFPDEWQPCIPGKRWPHTSSWVSSWWNPREHSVIPRDGREHWVLGSYFMWILLWIISPLDTRASHLIAVFLRSQLTHHSITPRSFFSLVHFSFPSSDISPALFLISTVMHMERMHFIAICRAHLPFEHNPWWKGRKKKSKKISLNSRLFSGSLNSTCVLVPNVIHNIFWTFRVAKPIGNQSWTRWIRWNTAVAGHVSCVLCNHGTYEQSYVNNGLFLFSDNSKNI